MLCLVMKGNLKERKRKERLYKERKRVESEMIVLGVWYKRKWNRKLKERNIYF
jgi:hypothetical protein